MIKGVTGCAGSVKLFGGRIPDLGTLIHTLFKLQVVVEDEVTAKDIIQNGRLSKRVTIIPLNKVRG